MPKLFISHATEDKEAFVEPLALALTDKGLTVWLDKDQITAGDSLRGKIDEGLCSCDYGVVVLSKHYLTKTWTQRELGALFALEGQSKKVVIPVLRGVTIAEVRKQSPLMADRYALSGDRGIDTVVEGICVAVGISNRSLEVNAKRSGISALASVNSIVADRQIEQRRMTAPNAGERIRQSFVLLQGEVSRMVGELESGETRNLFKFKIATREAFAVDGPSGLFAWLALHRVVENNAAEAELSVRIGKQIIDPYSDPKPATTLATTNYKARMVNDQEIHWTSDRVTLLSPSELANLTLERFAKHFPLDSRN